MTELRLIILNGVRGRVCYLPSVQSDSAIGMGDEQLTQQAPIPDTIINIRPVRYPGGMYAPR